MFWGKNELKNCSFLELQEGDRHKECIGVVSTIVFRTSRFIVYIDNRKRIAYARSADYGQDPADFGIVINKVDELENLASKALLGDSMSCKAQVAQGLVRVLDEGNGDSALNYLNKLYDGIHQDARHALKARYMLASLVSTLILILIVVLLWINRTFIINQVNVNAFQILLAACCGGIGAFISTFVRSLNFDADVKLSPVIYYLDGFLRIFFGVIAGAVLSLAIKANVILGFITEQDIISLALICFFSMIAGASERLIPSIIKKIEQEV
jgi:hypothetical protein